MTIYNLKNSGVWVVRVDGERIEGEELQTFKTHLRQLTSQPQCRFILDLRHVASMSLYAIGVLAESQKRLRRSKGEISLVGVKPELRELFAKVGVLSRFSLYESKDAALAEKAGVHA